MDYGQNGSRTSNVMIVRMKVGQTGTQQKLLRFKFVPF
jgi:hypothetical protein